MPEADFWSPFAIGMTVEVWTPGEYPSGTYSAQIEDIKADGSRMKVRPTTPAHLGPGWSKRARWVKRTSVKRP